MKLAAYIFAFLLSFYTLQPVVSSVINRVTLSGCAKQSHCCKKNRKVPVKKDNCENRGCNPFMGCVYGNFYMTEKSSISFTIFIIPKQKTGIFNDNRIVKNASDCWHPPKEA